MKALVLSLALIGFAVPILADPPKVVSATAQSTGMGWDISVTLAHPDTGWDHYADGWSLTSPTGIVYAVRELHHPHVKEQPFTRSLSNVILPDGTRQVHIHVRCSRDGWKDSGYVLTLTR